MVSIRASGAVNARDGKIGGSPVSAGQKLLAEADRNRTRPPTLAGALVLKIRDVRADWSVQC